RRCKPLCRHGSIDVLLRTCVKDLQFAKVAVFINGLVPLAIMGWDFANKQMGVNPVEYLIHTTGMLAMIFLLLSLCVTPLRRVTGRSLWSAFRRMLGLYAFFYATLHFSFYFILDRRWSVPALVDAVLYSDVQRSLFFFVGIVALATMVPLALTSTMASVKRLG